MEQYIPKSAFAAVIEKLKRKIDEHDDYANVWHNALSSVETDINFLEVKETVMPALDNGNMPVERWKEACKAASCQANYRKSKGLTETCDDYFVDGVQWADEHPKEEPTNKDFEMALAEMIDKAQKCVVEPLVVAEQWKDELIKLAKSEEHVSESIDFEQELYEAFGQIKDFTLGIAIAKRFYDMGRKHNEPVSEELEDAASSFARKDSEGISNPANFYYTIADKARIFKAGAEWQKARLMANATEVTVHLDAGSYPYIPQIELYDYDEDVPLAKEGDKYKVVLIKEN